MDRQTDGQTFRQADIDSLTVREISRRRDTDRQTDT